MALPLLTLAEPLIDGMVSLLKANLNPVIVELNATIEDGYTVPEVVQFVPYVPVPSILQAGMPAVGVHEFPGSFGDDNQFSMNATYEYGVVAILQNSDHQTLAMQLRRLAQAIAYTVQQDRFAGMPDGSGGIMRAAGAFSVNFMRTEPGPFLADLDPTTPEKPPHTYLSWTELIFSSMKAEI